MSTDESGLPKQSTQQQDFQEPILSGGANIQGKIISHGGVAGKEKHCARSRTILATIRDPAQKGY